MKGIFTPLTMRKKYLRRGESHHRCRWPDSIVRQARDMRAAGKSYGQIAMRLNVSIWTVRDWVNEWTRK